LEPKEPQPKLSMGSAAWRCAQATLDDLLGQLAERPLDPVLPVFRQAIADAQAVISRMPHDLPAPSVGAAEDGEITLK
jgi:hypothetical protein